MYTIRGKTYNTYSDIAADYGMATYSVGCMYRAGTLEEWLEVKDGRPCEFCGKIFRPVRLSHKHHSTQCYYSDPSKRRSTPGTVKKTSKNTAPDHVRDTYCTINRVRCEVHFETCGEGCYKEEDGKPACRVEPRRSGVYPVIMEPENGTPQ